MICKNYPCVGYEQLVDTRLITQLNKRTNQKSIKVHKVVTLVLKIFITFSYSLDYKLWELLLNFDWLVQFPPRFNH